jgi:hypothetical protein
MEHEAEEFEKTRRKAVDNAFEVLKKLPDFPSVQVEVMEVARDIRKVAPGWPLTNLPLSKRLEYTLKMLDAACSAYLKLVSDIVSQEAYTIILNEFVRTAWEEFVGMSGAEPLPRNREFQAIQEQGRHWHIESYKRLIDPGPLGEERLGSDEEPPDLIALRQQLLIEYKAATGNPSNRQIYRSRNAGIHKPQFYEWLNGTLSSKSATCINFERFLRERKKPIPKG